MKIEFSKKALVPCHHISYKMFDNKVNCKNCGHLVETKFCGHCGQKSNVSRINFFNFIKEFSQSFFQLNKGFFYTLRELFLRPGASLKEYLNGKRKSHFKPISYLLTLSTLYFFTAKLTNQNTWIAYMIEGMLSAKQEGSNVDIPGIVVWSSKNYAYLNLLLLPVFSLASYLSFLKFGKNYLEHIVINSYITGHQAIFYTLFVIGTAYTKSYILDALPLLVSVPYTFYVFWRFFSEGNRTMNILRSIMTYLLYIIFSVLIMFFTSIF